MNVSRGKALDVAAFYVAGAVTIAPDAAIAPGAVLKAMPGSHLVISRHVCIGAGVVIQAQQGGLTIGEGANLGTGVLVIGYGWIGAHACIGAESTLLNPQVAEAEIVRARSLLGDHSRHSATQSGSTVEQNGNTATPEAYLPRPQSPGTPASNGTATTLETSSGTGTIYGREQITLLIKTLFPHRQPLSIADSENSP